MKFKAAVIGAGSGGFTREIIKDLLSVEEFHEIDLAFTDINQKIRTSKLVEHEV